MKAGEILRAAADLVDGDRQKQHGDKLQNMEAIAGIWTAILRTKGALKSDESIDAHDAANMLEGLKIARRYTGVYNKDDYVDGAGYSGVAGEIANLMQKPEAEIVIFPVAPAVAD